MLKFGNFQHGIHIIHTGPGFHTSHLTIRTQYTTQYGDDVQHDNRYKILPFGSIRTVCDLRLNIKPSARNKKQSVRTPLHQQGVNWANLITIK